MLFALTLVFVTIRFVFRTHMRTNKTSKMTEKTGRESIRWRRNNGQNVRNYSVVHEVSECLVAIRLFDPPAH